MSLCCSLSCCWTDCLQMFTVMFSDASNACFVVKKRLPEGPAVSISQFQSLTSTLRSLVYLGFFLVWITCKQRGLVSGLDFCVVFTGWTALTFDWLKYGGCGWLTWCGNMWLACGSMVGYMFIGGMPGYGTKGGIITPGPTWGIGGGTGGGYGIGEQLTGGYVGTTGADGGLDEGYEELGENGCNAAALSWDFPLQFLLSCTVLLLVFWSYSADLYTWCTSVTSLSALYESFLL